MCQAGFHMLVLESGSALITVYGPLSSPGLTTVNKTHQAEAESLPFLLLFFLCVDDFTRTLIQKTS